MSAGQAGHRTGQAVSPPTTGPAKRRRGGTQPAPLARADIVRAALPLLARDGVDGLTVRAVADQLGISAPAVYHYFDSREDLLDRLCEQVTAEVDLTVDPTIPWDDAIVTVVLNMDRTFARYPGVATRVLPARRSPAAGGIDSTVLGLIVSAGFEPGRADELLAALHFLFGGWLLGKRPMLGDHTADPELLEQSIRWLLRGFAG